MSEPEARFRYSAERRCAARAKLELSAADSHLLVRALGLSVNKWERGTKPRAKFMPALAAALRMGKREASAQLLKLKQSPLMIAQRGGSRPQFR